ncbi:MAG TPA: hypothetical protein VFW02_03340 [Candidatus Limnocylindrales bacterium]|nr:hypothetical protein [Candidatus Limnocylindrales bacterium]
MEFMLTVSIFVIAVLSFDTIASLSLDAALLRWGAASGDRPADRHRR